MGLISYKLGQSSIILRVLILDSASTTGAGKTGLTYSSTGLRIGTIADNESSSTAYTESGATIQALVDKGTYLAPTSGKCRFAELDSTNHPGVYEIQIADARFAVSSAKYLLISITGASGAVPCNAVIPLVSDDPYVAKPTYFALMQLDSSGYVATNNAGDATAANQTAILNLLQSGGRS